MDYQCATMFQNHIRFWRYRYITLRAEAINIMLPVADFATWPAGCSYDERSGSGSTPWITHTGGCQTIYCMYKYNIHLNLIPLLYLKIFYEMDDKSTEYYVQLKSGHFHKECATFNWCSSDLWVQIVWCQHNGTLVWPFNWTHWYISKSQFSSSSISATFEIIQISIHIWVPILLIVFLITHKPTIHSCVNYCYVIISNPFCFQFEGMGKPYGECEEGGITMSECLTNCLSKGVTITCNCKDLYMDTRTTSKIFHIIYITLTLLRKIFYGVSNKNVEKPWHFPWTTFLLISQVCP